MGAKEYLDLNGSFYQSPLVDTVRKFHVFMESCGGTYAIIGGMAVLHHGGLRTTHDVDVLTTKEDWARATSSPSDDFDFGLDHAVDRSNNIAVDVLFAGDNWDTAIRLPDPKDTREYDDELNAYFINLISLLEIKTAVYIAKRETDGIELAAKDLSDIAMLIQVHSSRLGSEVVEQLHPAVKSQFSEILRNVRRASNKKRPGQE